MYMAPILTRVVIIIATIGKSMADKRWQCARVATGNQAHFKCVQLKRSFINVIQYVHEVINKMEVPAQF